MGSRADNNADSSRADSSRADSNADSSRTDHRTQTRHVPVRCAADHPDRCVGQTAKGQCPMLGMPHTYPRNNPPNSGKKPLCPLHGTPPRPSLYRIPNSAVTNRMVEMRQHPQNYTLENELALVRVLLETTLSQCTDAATLLIKAGPLLELTGQIDRLLGSNIKLAEKTGHLLSVEQVTKIAQSLIDIVADELTRAYPEEDTFIISGSGPSQEPAQDHATFLASVAARFEQTLNEPAYKGVQMDPQMEDPIEGTIEGEPGEGICVGGFLEDTTTIEDTTIEDPIEDTSEDSAEGATNKEIVR